MLTKLESKYLHGKLNRTIIRLNESQSSDSAWLKFYDETNDASVFKVGTIRPHTIERNMSLRKQIIDLLSDIIFALESAADRTAISGLFAADVAYKSFRQLTKK